MDLGYNQQFEIGVQFGVPNRSVALADAVASNDGVELLDVVAGASE
jgi:hypothetical protein